MPDSHPGHIPGGSRFKACWLAETLRLREALWGPLEDASEVRRVRVEERSFSDKILLRAYYLGKREKLDLLLDKWISGARLALAILCLLALIGGVGAALGALGDGSRPVNLLLALVALLGLNWLALAFWLLSFLFKSNGGAWLGESWLWLTRKLARGPDAALAPRALIEMLSRNQALRWLLGGVSHGLWLLALSSMLLAMLALLSARRYQFNWETTLLSPDTFVFITTWLGSLPGLLGFSMPPEAIIRISDGQHVLPDAAQSLWSGWLIGCLVVYGLLPRLLALACSLIPVRRTMARLTPDVTLPGYAELRDRLAPASETTGIDAPDAPGFQARVHQRTLAQHEPGQAMLAGIELSPETPWPPATLAASIADAGIIDSRSQRKALLDSLQEQAAGKLLLVCDPRQTPDRGTVALLADLASLAAQTRIVLDVQPMSADASRLSAWMTMLQAAGFDDGQLQTDLSQNLDWLAGTSSFDRGGERVQS
ncbi:DUF2868 domain-containing protein [Pusillimonas sp. MFBS29]|uniref:DUF2868 domain-containing protein n=1 Tax=Pusillimonas sp. MFBS29 TaxID=2886690 RepID=UPI001D129B16|nr:DUF2868 domain-containing protein [Pusillimonas sp. MFBS29]MCC2596261.1 DUF2868 domain-containing protein [Pusillimonas sp. MFBS29]